MTKKIKLTKGQYALVDDEDYELINQYNWQAHKHRNTWYAARAGLKKEGLCYGKCRHGMVRMHRQILNAPEGSQVDHINHNGLDNRKSNLRLVNNRENHQNRINQGASEYPGVSWDKQCKKWESYIHVGHKKYHLGYFLDEEKAHLKYLEAIHLLEQGREKEIPSIVVRPVTSSKHKYVTKCSDRDKWMASRRIRGKYYFLGRYDTEDEAAAVVRFFNKRMGFD